MIPGINHNLINLEKKYFKFFKEIIIVSELFRGFDYKKHLDDYVDWKGVE